MAKVSIIIPVYNVEKYVEKCLKSISHQSYKNLEIICIDDGSTDTSGSICDKYAEIDSRIKVIHKENGGVSEAKNIGLSQASGDYICFVDSDDYLEVNMISELYNLIKKNNCETIISGYKLAPKGKKFIPQYSLNKILTSRELIESNPTVHSSNDLCFSWRFLFKRDIIKKNNIHFQENISIGEDFLFNLEVLMNSNKIFVTDKCLYNYNIENLNSAMRTPYKEKLDETLLLQYEEKLKLSINSGLYEIKSYREDMANYYINGIMPMIFKNLYNSEDPKKKDAMKRILNYKMFRDSFKEIGLFYKATNYKEYIAYLILKFRIYPLAYRIINKQYKIN